MLGLGEGVDWRETALRVSIVGILGTDNRLIQHTSVVSLQDRDATGRVSVAYPLRTLVTQVNVNDVMPTIGHHHHHHHIKAV